MHSLRLRSLPIVLVIFFLSGCGDDSQVEETGPVVRPVKLITIDEASRVETSRFPAVISASRMSELSMQVGGLLSELPIREAQEVESGAVIARLDQRDFEASLQAAQAEFDNADAEYQRAVNLAEQNAIATSVLEQRRTQRDVAGAQLDSAQKALDDSTLRAPFDGVVAQVPVKELQTISAGTLITVFMADDSLEATIDLPASYIARIPKSENPDTSDRKAFVILDAAPNKVIEATFKEASLIADTSSQTYAVTFSFTPPEELTILPGMNATVELMRNATSSGVRVAVPLDAVLSDGENEYVWVVAAETMTVSKQSVAIEEGVGQMVVVTEGLRENQMIVGAGASYLTEGMEVSEWVN